MVQGNAERFREPGTASVDDALTEVLRQGAQELLRVAVEAEVGELLEHYAEERDSAGRQRLVRNGHLPERSIQTGIGDVPVRVPRVRDRGETEEPIRFESKLVPRYLRKSKSIEELLPLLYLRGISTGDFGEALSALLGPNAKGLSASTISRLKKDWLQEFESWSKRDLGRQQIVYLWADGIYCNVRFDDARLCLLVLIGADRNGQEATLGGSGGLSRERAVLAGDLDGSQAPRRSRLAQVGGRGWCPGLLEGDHEGIRRHPHPALLDAQDRECPELPAEVDAAQGEEGLARDLAGGDEGESL